MTRPAALGLVCGGGEDAGAGGSDGVAEGNAGAVGVEPVIERVDLPLAQDGEDLGGERLVEFDEVDLVEGEVGAVEGRRGGADWADAHDFRAAAGDRPG